MILADCDLRRGLHAKRWFDAVGHYSGEAALGTAERPVPSIGSPRDGDEANQ
jgi:hypothetical protein